MMSVLRLANSLKDIEESCHANKEAIKAATDQDDYGLVSALATESETLKIRAIELKRQLDEAETLAAATLVEAETLAAAKKDAAAAASAAKEAQIARADEADARAGEAEAAAAQEISQLTDTCIRLQQQIVAITQQQVEAKLKASAAASDAKNAIVFLVQAEHEAAESAQAAAAAVKQIRSQNEEVYKTVHEAKLANFKVKPNAAELGAGAHKQPSELTTDAADSSDGVDVKDESSDGTGQLVGNVVRDGSHGTGGQLVGGQNLTLESQKQPADASDHNHHAAGLLLGALEALEAAGAVSRAAGLLLRENKGGTTPAAATMAASSLCEERVIQGDKWIAHYPSINRFYGPHGSTHYMDTDLNKAFPIRSWKQLEDVYSAGYLHGTAEELLGKTRVEFVPPSPKQAPHQPIGQSPPTPTRVEFGKEVDIGPPPPPGQPKVDLTEGLALAGGRAAESVDLLNQTIGQEIDRALNKNDSHTTVRNHYLLNPVDLTMYTDYEPCISAQGGYTMSISAISAKAKNNEYKSPDEYDRDIKQIGRNAEAYCRASFPTIADAATALADETNGPHLVRLLTKPTIDAVTSRPFQVKEIVVVTSRQGRSQELCIVTTKDAYDTAARSDPFHSFEDNELITVAVNDNATVFVKYVLSDQAGNINPRNVRRPTREDILHPKLGGKAVPGAQLLVCESVCKMLGQPLPGGLPLNTCLEIYWHDASNPSNSRWEICTVVAGKYDSASTQLKYVLNQMLDEYELEQYHFDSEGKLFLLNDEIWGPLWIEEKTWRFGNISGGGISSGSAKGKSSKSRLFVGGKSPAPVVAQPFKAAAGFEADALPALPGISMDDTEQLIVSYTNKSGYKGVFPDRSRYQTRCDISPCRHNYLGMFDTPEEGAQAYLPHYQNTHPEELIKEREPLPVLLSVQEHLLIRSDKNSTGFKGVQPDKGQYQGAAPASSPREGTPLDAPPSPLVGAGDKDKRFISPVVVGDVLTNETRLLPVKKRDLATVDGDENVCFDPATEPQQYIGTRVEALWEAEKAWFKGTLTLYDPHRKRFKLKYDDGEEEWCTLPDKTIRVITGAKKLKLCTADPDADTSLDPKTWQCPVCPKDSSNNNAKNKNRHLSSSAHLKNTGDVHANIVTRKRKVTHQQNEDKTLGKASPSWQLDASGIVDFKRSTRNSW